jgi:hypothetical protein
MTKNLKIESTDSEAERGLAALAPYTTVSVTVATAGQPIRRPDGGTEHAEPYVQNTSEVRPGRELLEAMQTYGQRVEDCVSGPARNYKRQAGYH